MLTPLLRRRRRETETRGWLRVAAEGLTWPKGCMMFSCFRPPGVPRLILSYGWGGHHFAAGVCAQVCDSGARRTCEWHLSFWTGLAALGDTHDEVWSRVMVFGNCGCCSEV